MILETDAIASLFCFCYFFYRHGSFSIDTGLAPVFVFCLLAMIMDVLWSTHEMEKESVGF